MLRDAHSAFVRYEQLSDDRHVVTRIIPRSPHSLWLRPITHTITFEVEPGTAEHDAVTKFAQFGAPVSGISATTAAVSGPPGTMDGNGRAKVWFEPRPDGQGTGYELRVVNEEDQTVSTIELTNPVITTGADRSGTRVTGTDRTGVFSMEALFTDDSAKLSVHAAGWAGRPMATILPLARALAAVRPGCRFVLAVAGGPPISSWEPIADDAGFKFDLLDPFECLGVIQQHTMQTVTVPIDPSAEQIAAAARAGDLLSGTVFTARQHPFDFTVKRDGATFPGAEIAFAAHAQMAVQLDDTVYALDRMELVHCPQVRVVGVDASLPLRDGQVVRLEPLTDSTFRAVPMSGTPITDNLRST